MNENNQNYQNSVRKKKKSEGNKLPIIGRILFQFYRIRRRSIRSLIFKVLMRFEGERHSLTVRRILSTYDKIEIGMYTNVLPATLGAFPPGTKIGRFSSITKTVMIFGASHPMNTRSSHAIFYNPELKYVERDFLKRTAPVIGNDVFIGHNVIITNNVTSIGDGAYIGAGSVVTKDVPPYALVVGNPARIIRYRFSKKIIEELLKERWWEKSINELSLDLKKFHQPLDGSNNIR